MLNCLNTRFFGSLVLSLFLIIPITTQAAVDLVSESTFFKFSGAWLEISGEANGSVYEVATLYVRHIHINTGVERLLHVPVSVDFSKPSSEPYHFTNTWTVRMGNLEGKTLSDIFSFFHKTGLKLTAGFISREEMNEIYVIYSDRDLVEIVDLKTILDLPL